ncbi:LytR/AlgR family response regulator transcription factor [Luteirhabdus pelagi]|uniref:LytR/AlgR family response regulator transcription factor n=1 Tax=Luteirhabdus pelagi TaxID=2792783 RepID=UPI00193A5AD9|nr:LytTR family DNA-binding domain-containing protein [Luteirhabdus pelagi]
MIQCVIIDDEKNAIEALALELSNYEIVSIENTFTSSKQALDFVLSHPVDVVFLDIEMPEINGMEFAEKIKPLGSLVIFTTAYSEYAVEAIKKGAFDYLLKPIDTEDLEQCINKIIEKQNALNIEKRLNDAFTKLNSNTEIPSKIKIPTEGKLHYVRPQEILYCKADGSYTHFFTVDETPLMVSQRLKKVSAWLPDQIFYRVHNSYIVNIEKIKEFNRNENYILLEDGTSIPVSRQRKGDLLKNT